MPNSNLRRDLWNTRTGLILAMAGNAIGLGNFLRFPVQAAENGGGAFMVPYIIAFIVIGIPIMWAEWAMGRFGGSHGHGTTPAIFNLFWKSSASKILGVFGLWIPLVVSIYYIYIESWTLGYSLHFILGNSPDLPAHAISDANEYVKPFSSFLGNYIGVGENSSFFTPSKMAIIAFILTIFINIYILFKGISKGIEVFAKIALPTLFILAIILLVRVVTLSTENGTAIQGLEFLWKPDFSTLRNPSVWIAAAGQIFFTLSLGFGAIITYASYVKQDQDITLSGLTSATLNETTEVVLGGSIAIPAAVAFFGVTGAVTIAQSGAFNLGFVSLPAIFASIPGNLGSIELGRILGFLWFFLLFFAGLTSSVAITQPVITFIQDEFNLIRKKAVIYTMIIIAVSVLPVIFINQVLDEWDFWAGTIGVVLFGFIELIFFMWIFGSEKAWEEINRHGLIKAPRIFYYLLKYITPLFLLFVITWWGFEFLPAQFAKTTWNIWFARFYLVGLFIFLSILVFISNLKEEK
ncbi:MAG: sodium:calcium symporter [Candidatus Dadabacteria bacterium]|nr:sodium:calcium symporter [Candidatus Dadabacteria bacterium]NIQ14355.1 sodium:calcium symporter [Candidatus Dadabacteria bacterium]